MRWPWIFIVTAIIGCDTPLRPDSFVDALQVLAVRATPPWPAPGASATLEALVVAPPGETVRYAWSWCPFSGSAANGYPCLFDELTLKAELDAMLPRSSATLPSYDLGEAATATLPHTVSPLLLRRLCNRAVDEALAGPETDCDPGLWATVALVATTATETVRATKKVFLSFTTSAADNRNPAIGGVLWHQQGSARLLDDQGSVVLPHDAAHALNADVPDSGAETYAPTAGGASRERLLLSWFIDTGALDAGRFLFIPGETPLAQATANVWTLPSAPERVGSPARLWAVLRDNRDGADWVSVVVTIEAAP